MITAQTLRQNSKLATALIAINVVVYLAQLATQDSLTNDGLLWGPAVDAGEWWRIVTSAFLHANPIHIGFNMYLLHMLGRELERTLGMVKFGIIYAGSLFGGAMAVLLFNWPIPTLGASGAVLGLAGGLFAVMWGAGQDPRRSPVFTLVLLNLALPLIIGGISFWGHLGGVVVGAIMGTIVFTLPHRGMIPKTAAVPLGIAAVVAFAVLSLIAGSLAL